MPLIAEFKSITCLYIMCWPLIGFHLVLDILETLKYWSADDVWLYSVVAMPILFHNSLCYCELEIFSFFFLIAS